MIDWSDGEYELTAETLDAASKLAVDAARIARGTALLDLGAGTGNAALEAARRGARVVAVEPAARLLEVARARAAREGLSIDARQGDASRIPAEDASFDVVLSVFAVIFAPDPELAVSEMLRVVQPGGLVVLTSWVLAGPIAEAGAILRGAIEAASPASSVPAAARPAARWGESAFIRGLFEPRGAAVDVEEQALVFEAASPEAWLAEQEAHHPVWRFGRRALEGHPGAWDAVRERSLERLRAGNEASEGFRATSRYHLVRAISARP